MHNTCAATISEKLFMRGALHLEQNWVWQKCKLGLTEHSAAWVYDDTTIYYSIHAFQLFAFFPSGSSASSDFKFGVRYSCSNSSPCFLLLLLLLLILSLVFAVLFQHGWTLTIRTYQSEKYCITHTLYTTVLGIVRWFRSPVSNRSLC